MYECPISNKVSKYTTFLGVSTNIEDEFDDSG